MGANGALVAVLIAAGSMSATGRAADLPKMPEPLENVTLPDKPAGAHWIWIADFQNGDYSRSLLYDADAGRLLGMIDIGWEGIKLEFPRHGDEIYNLAMYMSRAYRGERTDALTTYDRHTLKPLREVVVPPKGIHGWPDPNHGALSDDDRFMWMQFFTPSSSIGVVDLKANKYIAELETSGCAHVMAAGARQLFTLCGDGSALAIKIGDDGREVSRQRYPGFFDADKDPLHGSGMRSGNTWYFVSFRGMVHEIQVEDGGLRFGPVWPVSEKLGAMTWVPGPLMQPLAIHDGSRRLYVLMHPSDLKPKGGGYDFHRETATEVWSYDLATRTRLKRIALKNGGNTLAVSQDETPLIYVGSLLHLVVTAYDERSGAEKREIPVATYPTLLQPVR
ncbi:MAG TPA: amine dehydrogenase large subunit [Steroidobacteraceae bacterium]|jgi:methylamine dehydrogenase heavy chain|nr:amine dehydrogenase large subunit [Steroidobacteraceae bacterium]